MSLVDNSALALHEILLTIAASLNEAQQQLRDMPPYDQFGRPNVLYTLPHLDFDIKVETEIANRSTTSSVPSSSLIRAPQAASSRASESEIRTATGQRAANYDKTIGLQKSFARQIASPAIYFKPVSKTTSTSDTSKLTSSIQGRFVAVVPNQGMPQVFLSHSMESIGSTHVLKVLVSNSAGEKIPDVKVEINFVEEDSDLISSVPTYAAAEVTTSNADGVNYGVAEFTITTDPADSTKHMVFVINAGPINKLISIN